MAANNVFTSDHKLAPYWWDHTPRPSLDKSEPPSKIDVAIIGSGYTGLNAALVVARAGRSTAIFDADDAGFGCSSRNGGQISASVKPGLPELARRHGEQQAREIIQEGQKALLWINEFISAEQIDCDFKVPGRFHAAHNTAQFKKLVRQVRNQPKGLEVPCHAVPRSEQQSELGSEAYHGGVVFENHASLDPARYHQGLLDRAMDAGVQVISQCSVKKVSSKGEGFLLNTTRGNVLARDVIVASNGYTSELTPWLQRRVIPIGSYMIATEPLEAELMNRLMPTNRIVSDSRKIVYYYRPSPDRKRIIFGGRVSSSETDPEKSAPLLKRDLAGIFPELNNVKVSHSWMGFVAYTFDTLAHIGKYEGIYYAMGYCGSGVSMASYLGMRIGQQLLGMKEGKTGFDNIKFPTRPFYTGKPWFLSASVAWYRGLDRLNI